MSALSDIKTHSVRSPVAGWKIEVNTGRLAGSQVAGKHPNSTRREQAEGEALASLRAAASRLADGRGRRV